jgi:hypothetical protein
MIPAPVVDQVGVRRRGTTSRGNKGDQPDADAVSEPQGALRPCIMGA